MTMKKPAYVPLHIYDDLQGRIHGDEICADGLCNHLKKINKRIGDIQVRLKYSQDRSEEDIDRLRVELHEAQNTQQDIQVNINLFQRLLFDERMKPCYEILSSLRLTEQQYNNLLLSTWVGQVNYTNRRETLQRVREHKRIISKKTKELITAIQKANELPYSNWPSEFGSIESLIVSSTHSDQSHKGNMFWPSMKYLVLGRNKPKQELTPAISNDIEVQFIATSKEDTRSHEEKRASALRYAWEQSPPLVDILHALSTSLENFEPTEPYDIGEALTRKTSHKENRALTKYIVNRCISNSIKISETLKPALCTLIEVAINDKDLTLTPNDITKALPTDTR